MSWPRVALVVRKHFGVQPDEFWYGWDIRQVQDAMALTSEQEADWCYVEKWRHQDISDIPQVAVKRG